MTAPRSRRQRAVQVRSERAGPNEIVAHANAVLTSFVAPPTHGTRLRRFETRIGRTLSMRTRLRAYQKLSIRADRYGRSRRMRKSELLMLWDHRYALMM